MDNYSSQLHKSEKQHVRLAWQAPQLEYAPGFLAGVPADPFSGTPPEYRPAGGGYLLRSVAEDAKLSLIDNRDPMLRWEVRR